MSERAQACGQRFTVDETVDLTVAQRIANGDREAIYDAIVEAASALDTLREQIGGALADGEPEVMARTAELRAAKAAGRCTAVICSARWGQETGATDRTGKERRRIAASKGKAPAGHG